MVLRLLLAGVRADEAVLSANVDLLFHGQLRLACMYEGSREDTPRYKEHPPHDTMRWDWVRNQLEQCYWVSSVLLLTGKTAAAFRQSNSNQLH